jgi:membrane protein
VSAPAAQTPAAAAPTRRTVRPLYLRVYWTLRDYVKRVWDNSGEDNIFFLAGGISFNILLAAVPFALLLVSGLAGLLGASEESSSATIITFVDGLLPTHDESPNSPIHRLLLDIIHARGSVGLYAAIGFVWFSTRLFGSLRTVLAEVFDVEQERGIVGGKIFDMQITIVATLLFVAYTFISAYLVVGTSRGVAALGRIGVEKEVMGLLEYRIGQLLAFVVILLMFFALYKFLPNRRIRWQTAGLAALTASLFFELAKYLFDSYVKAFSPGSLYTGTLYALVIIVLWVYYASLLFIIGGEVAQVYELRRVRRRQHERFFE